MLAHGEQATLTRSIPWPVRWPQLSGMESRFFPARVGAAAWAPGWIAVRAALPSASQAVVVLPRTGRLTSPRSGHPHRSGDRTLLLRRRRGCGQRARACRPPHRVPPPQRAPPRPPRRRAAPPAQHGRRARGAAERRPALYRLPPRPLLLPPGHGRCHRPRRCAARPDGRALSVGPRHRPSAALLLPPAPRPGRAAGPAASHRRGREPAASPARPSPPPHAGGHRAARATCTCT